jgi:aspartokinase-like uncharacterized kinase
MQPLVPLRIIKLGGSLLTLKDLRQRLDTWLAKQTSARNLLVVGGGAAVESIRELDALHHFPPKLTHWTSVEMMAVTATLASQVLGLERPISTEAELHKYLSSSGIPSIACIQPTAYYSPSIAHTKDCDLPESHQRLDRSLACQVAHRRSACLAQVDRQRFCEPC